MHNSHLKDLTDCVGQFIEYWGFKSIDGKVWALIFISKEPISTPQIVTTLKVSKGLVSTAINELLDLGLIIKDQNVSYGAFTYSSNCDVGTAIKSILEKRELKLLDTTCDNLKKLSELSKVDQLDLNLDKNKIDSLLKLTQLHKTLLQKVIKSKISHVDSWINLVTKWNQLFKK